MREIKFRVWYEPTKEMLYGISVNELGWIYKDGRFARDNEGVMQYTGLKDKNGKEIYEGDAVEIAGNFSGQVFDRLGCWFIEMGKELGYYPDCDTEVIGNIYETPELLEAK